MRNSYLFTGLLLLGVLFATGCSGARGPVDLPLSQSGEASIQASSPAYTHLWGYYDVDIDIPSQTATAVENRQAMFTANVVNFINNKPAGLSFHIKGTSVGPEYIEVDIDVSISHPFPGLHQYDGYDVRGVFMGDGSASLATTGGTYPRAGTDQMMLADSHGFGGPDGYTRWFNIGEFSEGGMPLFSYTEGKLASPGFNGTATLNAYKYFMDGLGPTGSAFVWLDLHADQHGVFSSGATNTRDYHLRFPNGKGVVFGYAILANWTGAEPEYHPSNAPEAVASAVDDNSNVFYVDDTNKGGIINLDFSLFGWHGQPSAIYIESTVLSGLHQLDASEMIPVGGDENYSTWHVEIPADNITGTGWNDYWIIAEYSAWDYSNDFGTPNLAQDDPLTAYFRYYLDVSPSPVNQKPVCDLEVVTPLPAEGWDAGTPVEFDASGSTDADGDPLTFSWDFDGDGVYGEDPDDSFVGDPATPTHYYTDDYSGQVCVKVTDGQGGESICCVDIEVIVHPSKNIPLRDGVQAIDIAIDHTNGDLLVLYFDRTIYRHTLDQWYQDGTLYIDIEACGHLPKVMYALDIAPNRYLGIALTYVTDETPGYFIYDPDAGFNLYAGQSPPAGPEESYTMTAGVYENDMGFIRGVEWPGILDTLALRLTKVGDWYAYGDVHQYNIYDGNTFGYDRVYYEYMKGAESDAYGNYIWILEDPDYYAARWELAPYSVLKYDNAYFGTGSQTNADNGWNDAKDITRDDQNRYFVLDRLSSNEPRIKMWTVSGNTTTSEGSFGNSTSISGAPVRIEGSDYDGDIVVLHGSSAPYMISVFVPSEMPS